MHSKNIFFKIFANPQIFYNETLFCFKDCHGDIFRKLCWKNTFLEQILQFFSRLNMRYVLTKNYLPKNQSFNMCFLIVQKVQPLQGGWIG